MQSTKTSIHKIHYFNPGHETAVLSGSACYTPTAIVQKMIADLSLLPAWYGDSGDYVLVDNVVTANDFLSSIPAGLLPKVKPVSLSACDVQEHSDALEAAPWGLSPQSIHLFKMLKKKLPNLIIPQWNNSLRYLTGRYAAVDCQRELSSLDPDLMLPQFFANIADIRRFAEENNPPYIIKTPYSSSGRGIKLLPDKIINEQAQHWINGALRKQQSVSIETALDKVCDFAMEFESDGQGRIIFKGLSVFDTSHGKAYSGNYLRSQCGLNEYITSYVPADTLTQVRKMVMSVLKTKIGTIYKGCLGVDMMIYRKAKSLAIHPFVEMNLRRTMGLVSMELYERLIYPSSQGYFCVNYQPSGEALKSHIRATTEYPLHIEDGKIRSGYFSLCPVNAETQYRAYISVK